MSKRQELKASGSKRKVVIATAAAAVLLAGCDMLSGGKPAAQQTPAQQAPSPSLASVPERPRISTAGERSAAASGLAADRDRARYDDDVRATDETRGTVIGSVVGARRQDTASRPPSSAPVSSAPSSTPAAAPPTPVASAPVSPATPPPQPAPTAAPTPTASAIPAPTPAPESSPVASAPAPAPAAAVVAAPAPAPAPAPVASAPAPTPGPTTPVPSPSPAPAVAAATPAAPQMQMADPARGQSGPTDLPIQGVPNPLQLAVIQFGQGSSGLSGEDMAILADVARIQRRNGGTVRILGHASRDSSGASVAQMKNGNLQVSMRRAEAVARQLTRNGVPANAIIVEALADEEPAYETRTARGVAANRRAEVFLEF